MNFANCRRLVSLFVYCGVAVLVIVNGQSTTDDDIDKHEMSRLIDMVEVLRAQQVKSADTISSMKSEIAKLTNNRMYNKS